MERPAAEQQVFCTRASTSAPRFQARERRAAAIYARRKGEHGSAILETFYSMILIGMILFGILQIFQLVVADMVVDYTAFRGARSGAVGFKQEYAFREALIKSVPASGALIVPDPEHYPGFVRNSGASEQSILREFMKDECYVEYAHWRGIDAFHMNYTCPFYGAPKDAPCEICDGGRFWTTGINMSMDGAGETTDFVFEIINYPLTIPLHDLLTGRPCITISGKAKLTNHSAAFLELD